MNKMTIKGEFSVDNVKRGPIVEIEVEEHRGVIFMPDDIIAQLNKAWGGFDWTGCEFLVTKVFNKRDSLYFLFRKSPYPFRLLHWQKERRTHWRSTELASRTN